MQEDLRKCKVENKVRVINSENVSEYTFGSVKRMAIPASTDFLRSQYIWVSDTGAAVHSTFDASGGINVRKGNDVTIIGQIGSTTMATKVMDLRGTWYDKYGNDQLYA